MKRVELGLHARQRARKRGATEAEVQAVCSRVERFGVETSSASDLGVRQRYLAAHALDLTAYDATYLDLAMQRRCALATLDQQMAQAARRAGVHVLD